MTTRNFQDMLNEHLSYDLLMEEFLPRVYLLNNVTIDKTWYGGKWIVPFEGQYASTISFGELAADSDVSEYDYVRGSIDDYVESWATLKFNQRDLMDHKGRVPESTFLKILPNQIDRMMGYFKTVVSQQITNGSHFATLTVSGTAAGVITVDKIDRFTLGQKVVVDSSAISPITGFVRVINRNLMQVTLFDARTGGAAVNMSTALVADGAKCYHQGVISAAGVVTNFFNSLRGQLLSLANGGDANIAGTSKLAYPYLQATNVSGSDIDSSNILDKMFDAYTAHVIRGVDKAPTKFLMSFKNLGSCMKLIETQKGGFKTTATQTKASQYGWTEIDIFNIRGGSMSIVGIQEMDDDIIIGWEPSSCKFGTHPSFFAIRTAPDGKQYYEIRNTSGYVYLLDIAFQGQFVVHAPSRNFIVYGIDY